MLHSLTNGTLEKEKHGSPSDRSRENMEHARQRAQSEFLPADASLSNSRLRQQRVALGELQTTLGNQGVLRRLSRFAASSAPASSNSVVLQRKCDCGGDCSECQKTSAAQTIQTKLHVSSPGDRLEQEADQIAEHVLRSSISPESMKTRSRDLPATRSASAAQIEVNANAQSQIGEVLSSGGLQLPASVRGFMEPRFGHNFGDVRVHRDERAAQSAEAVKALAFTVGNNIVFGSGRYAPETTAGRRLLAHELSHVVQQRGGVPALVQREEDQNETGFTPADGEAAKDCLEKVGKSITDAQDKLKCATGPEAADLKEAVQTLSDLYSNNKIVCGSKEGGKDYAVYNNNTKEIHIYTNHGSVQSSPANLIHEAIHAVHANRFPKISEMYSKGKAKGDDAVLLLKWKAWTEYWAYRREYEYGNLGRTEENRLDADKLASTNKDVTTSVAKVKDYSGEDFVPSTWNPPEKYRAKTPDQATQPGQKQSAAETPSGATDSPDERAAQTNMLLTNDSCQTEKKEESVAA